LRWSKLIKVYLEVHDDDDDDDDDDGHTLHYVYKTFILANSNVLVSNHIEIMQKMYVEFHNLYSQILLGLSTPCT
jgi:hypothetical protein